MADGGVEHDARALERLLPLLRRLGRRLLVLVEAEHVEGGVAPLGAHRAHVRDALPVAVVRDVRAVDEREADDVGEHR
eukprot:6358564-Prymnesium_polylepis.1